MIVDVSFITAEMGGHSNDCDRLRLQKNSNLITSVRCLGAEYGCLVGRFLANTVYAVNMYSETFFKLIVLRRELLYMHNRTPLCGSQLAATKSGVSLPQAAILRDGYRG